MHAIRMALIHFSLGMNGDEDSMRGAWLRLGVHAEAGFGEEPAPVLRRVLVVNGEEAAAPAPTFGGTLAQDLAPPRQIGSERLADPVVEQEEASGSEYAPHLG